MSQHPNPPPPRRDIPCPAHLTEEQYAAFLAYLASAPPDIWRSTDGTLYLTWIPTAMYPTGEAADTYIPIKPSDPHYGRYLDDLLSQFDYVGMEVPRAQGAVSHSDGR